MAYAVIHLLLEDLIQGLLLPDIYSGGFTEQDNLDGALADLSVPPTSYQDVMQGGYLEIQPGEENVWQPNENSDLQTEERSEPDRTNVISNECTIEFNV